MMDDPIKVLLYYYHYIIFQRLHAGLGAKG